MRKCILPIFIILSLTLLSSCSAESGNAESKPTYDQIKQMVKDIMQTEDGQKAIQASLKDEEIKKALLFDGEEVKQHIENTLLSEKGVSSFQKMMDDPKFSSKMAKALQKENEKIQKDLMKDPEYQKMLIAVMKDPEYEKNMLDLMKSAAYRQQMMAVIKESLQSPLFQEDLLKLLTKVQEEASKPKKKGEEDKKGGGDGGGGGGSDSGGGGQ